jgi:bifunctional non-homologous end joining protein LigD
LLLKHGKRVEIRSRNDKDLTRMYRAIAAAGLRLKAVQAVVDGEIVALDEQGRPSFQALQHPSAYPGHQIVFYAFDLLQLNGQDLTREPLTSRREKLSKIVTRDGAVRLVPELPGTATEVVEAVRALGLEGVIAKRKDSLYQPGERSNKRYRR